MNKVVQFLLEEEFKKPTGITPRDIADLRQWLIQQPHLPSEYISDLDLVLAYHCCDRSTEVAKQTLDLHYTLKTLFTTLFQDRIFDPELEKCMNRILIKPLSMRTKDGYAILYIHFMDTDLQTFTPTEYIRLVTMVLDLWQYEEGTWPGLVIVVNLSGVSLGHALKVDLGMMQQHLYFIQEAMLLKLKHIIMINSPSMFDKMLAIFKPFLKNSLLQKLHIFQDVQGAHELFPIEALPIEAGGSHKSLEECEHEMIEKFRANQEFFETENKKRVNESKRPGKPKNMTDIFSSVEGSFKKLDID